MPWPDQARIAARLEELWQIARGPGGGADRPAFSLAEAEAMRLVAGWAREIGLDPGLDRHGNLWALPAGWSGPVVTAGSHVDTVPDGGRYDGALGTVLGLELALGLTGGERGESEGDARAGVLVCVAEEAPRFGAGTVGSRLLVGTLPESALQDLHDAHGCSAAAARREYLEALPELPRIEPPADRWVAHVAWSPAWPRRADWRSSSPATPVMLERCRCRGGETRWRPPPRWCSPSRPPREPRRPRRWPR